MFFLTFLFTLAIAYMSFDLIPVKGRIFGEAPWCCSDKRLQSESVLHCPISGRLEQAKNFSLRIDTRGGLLWFPATGGDFENDYLYNSFGTCSPEDLILFTTKLTMFPLSGEVISVYDANDMVTLGGERINMSFCAATRSRCFGVLGVGSRIYMYTEVSTRITKVLSDYLFVKVKYILMDILFILAPTTQVKRNSS